MQHQWEAAQQSVQNKEIELLFFLLSVLFVPMIRRLDFGHCPMAECAACVIIPTAFAPSARREHKNI